MGILKGTVGTQSHVLDSYVLMYYGSSAQGTSVEISTRVIEITSLQEDGTTLVITVRDYASFLVLVNHHVTPKTFLIF